MVSQGYLPQCNNSSRELTDGFGIYVHFPFCVQRCSYCEFYSSEQRDLGFLEAYVDRLLFETRGLWGEVCRKEGPPPVVGSLYLGGGTPSLVPAKLLGRLCREVQALCPFGEAAEITIEVNPETVGDGFCEALRKETPINRLSLGVQSFQDHHLRNLERLASVDQIYHAVRRVKDGGFENLSFDLIYGLPGQGVENLLSDLKQAVGLQPKHLSCYGLSLRPDHRLKKNLPSSEVSALLFESVNAQLSGHGFHQYEISNYAVPGFESVHNLLYWNGGDFIGVGPSAASRLFGGGTFRHRKQVSDLEAYMQGETISDGFQTSTAEQTLLEATFLEIRKNSGVMLTSFAKRYGWDLRQGPKYSLLVDEGLIEEAGTHLRLTSKGRLLADSIALDLVPR